jgi:hypothetical protein
MDEQTALAVLAEQVPSAGDDAAVVGDTVVASAESFVDEVVPADI